MANPAIAKIGAWNYATSAFVAHPSSPTNAIFDINDGTIFTLTDTGAGTGNGINLTTIDPNTYTTTNPRVTGEIIKRRAYNKNRTVIVNLTWGAGTSYSSWITAIHNLVQLLEGITPELQGVLQFQATMSSTPIYFDIVSAQHNIPYSEIEWYQLIQTGVVITLTCKPYARLTRQWLQNLVMNPGFEDPGSMIDNVQFWDTFSNFNAYTVQAGGALANGTLLTYPYVTTEDAPIRYLRLGEPSGSTAYDTEANGNGTHNATPTLGVSGLLAGDSTTCVTYAGGSSQYTNIGLTSLPSGNTSWTIECWFKFTGTISAFKALLGFGDMAVTRGAALLQISSAQKLYASVGTSGTDTTPSATLTADVAHHAVATYDGTTLTCYLDGVYVDSKTQSTCVLTPNYANIACTPQSARTNFFSGQIQEVTIYNKCLSYQRVAAHYLAGSISPTSSVYASYVTDYPALRYYRFGEASGTTANEVYSTTYAGTYTASGVSYGVTGALSGDPNKAVTLNGTTGYCSIPTTGLSSGNSSWSVSLWMKYASLPGSDRYIVDFGTYGSTRQHAGILLDHTTGGVSIQTNGSNTAVSSALSTGTWHHLVMTWNGTVLNLYIDGVLGPTLTPGVALSITYGYFIVGATAAASPSLFFPGSVDELDIYTSALSATHIANQYGIGATTPTLLPNTMKIPAGGRVSFGAKWQNFGKWYVPFQFAAGATYKFYTAYNDANNYLNVQITQTAVTANYNFAGVTGTVSTSAVNLIPGALYLLQISVVAPTVTTNTPAPIAGSLTGVIQLNVFNGGNLGTALVNTSFGFATTNGWWYQPQIEASGAQLTLNGYSYAHSVYGFGPGGWYFYNSGTGVASAMWDQRAGYQYAGACFTSLAALLLQAPPAGTFAVEMWNTSARLVSTSPQALALQTGIPCAAGDVLGYSVFVKSSGLAVSCSQYLNIYEYDTTGAYLRYSSSTSLTGNQAAFTEISGTITTGANAAYVMLVLVANDATANSASGLVWFDNCKIWNQTTTQATMPYCELRHPKSVCVFSVSGIIGDGPAPATLAITLFDTTLLANQTISYILGRASKPQAVNYFIQSQLSDGIGIPTFDAGCYGSYYLTYTSVTSLFGGTTYSDITATGSYRFLTKMQINASTPGSTGLQIQGIGSYNSLNYNAQLLQPTTPFSASSSWVIADGGQIYIPLGAIGSRVTSYTFNAQYLLTGGTPTSALMDVSMLMPNDAELFSGTITTSSTLSNFFASIFLDGDAQTTVASSMSPANNHGFIPKYASAVVPMGNIQTAWPTPNIGVVASGASIPYVDPKLALGTTRGVNQWAFFAMDYAGYVSLPTYMEVSYEPVVLLPM